VSLIVSREPPDDRTARPVIASGSECGHDDGRGLRVIRKERGRPGLRLCKRQRFAIEIEPIDMRRRESFRRAKSVGHQQSASVSEQGEQVGTIRPKRDACSGDARRKSNAIRAVGIDNDVVPRRQAESIRVVVGATDCDVVARIKYERVVAAISDEKVVAIAARKRIVAFASE